MKEAYFSMIKGVRVYNPFYLCYIIPADKVANGQLGCKGGLHGESLSCDDQAQKKDKLIFQSPAQFQKCRDFPATCK